jgi:hypothetical protein
MVIGRLLKQLLRSLLIWINCKLLSGRFIWLVDLFIALIIRYFSRLTSSPSNL